MIAGAKAAIPASVYPIFQADVEGQANAYSAGLQWGAIETFVAIPVWMDAQVDARCRTWSYAMKYYCH